MNLKLPFFSLVIVLLFCLSCRKEKLPIIPEELHPYVNSFIDEANIRGMNLDWEDLDVEIKLVDLENEHHLGECNSRRNEIFIDADSWSNKDDANREWILFHELGHCFLNRSHRNELTSSWECLSYMKGGIEDGFDCSLNLYSSKWREYYLDELFDSSTNLPDWYYLHQGYHINESDRIYQTNIDLLDTYGYFDTLSFTEDENFVIEIEFLDDWADKTNSIGIRWNNYYLTYCNPCTEKKLKIKADNSTVYGNNFLSSGNVKLTIKKQGDYYQVYFNEEIAHVFEFVPWEDDNTFRTLSFDEEISISVKVFTF